jgi:Na+/proline symporter
MMNPGASQRRQMVVARLTTFLVGALVIGFTFVMRYAQGANDLFDVTNQLFGVFGNPIAVPVVVGLLSRRFSRFAGFAGLVVGIGAGVLAFVVGHWIPCLREMIQMNAITTTATLLGMIWGTLWHPDSAAEQEDKRAFFSRLEKRG